MPVDTSSLIPGTPALSAVVKAIGDLGNATEAALPAKAADAAVVHVTGAETVAGVKTFSSSPIVPTATTTTQAVNKAQLDAAIPAVPASFDLTKLADQSVTSSTTLVDDDTLKFTVTTGTVWDVSVILHNVGDVVVDSGDFKAAITGPSGSTVFGIAQGLSPGSGSVTGGHTTKPILASAGTMNFGTIGAAVVSAVAFNFRITAGAAGDVKLQWAQDFASATPTKVLAGSNLVAVQKP